MASVSLTRRAAAKAIDMVVMAFTITGFTFATDSYLVGLLVGYGWWASCDWSGSPGKWLLKLRVVPPGDELTLTQSVLRNLPLVAANLPHRLHQALLDVDRTTYRVEHDTMLYALGAIELAILAALIVTAKNHPEGQHLGDRIAGTKVVARDLSA